MRRWFLSRPAFLSLALSAIFAMTLAGCGDTADSEDNGEGNGSTETSGTGDNGGSESDAQDIVDTAVAADGFETLVAAVKAAELVETLKGKGPFTVFAPTDEAFAALPAGTVDNLLLPENKDQLAAVLTYHVVPGKVMAADVIKLDAATTVQGTDVTIKVDGDKVMVDGANVVKTDIECSNGVIHVIDAVILPKD